VAMACDLRIMAKEAYIMSVFSNIALVPDGGLSFLLARSIGYSRALEFAIEAKKISAEECLSLGIANKVVDLDELSEATMQWAKHLSKRSPQALARTKELMRNALTQSYDETFAEEAKIQQSIFGNEENLEGITAFFKKKEPNFK